jgi:hypothetical protein
MQPPGAEQEVGGVCGCGDVCALCSSAVIMVLENRRSTYHIALRPSSIFLPWRAQRPPSCCSPCAPALSQSAPVRDPLSARGPLAAAHYHLTFPLSIRSMMTTNLFNTAAIVLRSLSAARDAACTAWTALRCSCPARTHARSCFWIVCANQALYQLLVRRGSCLAITCTIPLRTFPMTVVGSISLAFRTPAICETDRPIHGLVV